MFIVLSAVSLAVATMLYVVVTGPCSPYDK
ncbi:hypothetical protein [Klebsiella phage vB_KpnP_cmc355D]|uniref:Uncharacterized protein n=1 Tax=Klebsiella phage vB_KpnP_cmc355D TaxID=3110534 RepID=A0ABZ0ZZH1_9CAUD|nr:hypothetical protein [Klebsiella phage vB_KpnP_cmc355D]